MSDRDYADVLVQRARMVLAKARAELDPPQNADGKMAPHVAFDKVIRMREVVAELDALAGVAAAAYR